MELCSDQGGGYARSVSIWNEQIQDESALERRDLRAGRERRQVPMGQIGRALTNDDAPLMAVCMIGVNALVSFPSTELTRRGLLRDDLFTIVHEQFITDTARYADIVLPATTQLEAIDVVPSWGHMYTGWNEPAIAPLGESISNSELHRRLARAMGFTEPSLFDDDITALRAALPTIDVDALRRDGWVKVPYPTDGRPWADGGFPTASGKVELRCDSLTALGHPALPTFTPASEWAGADRFPFMLLTPKQHTRFLNSSYSHLPKHGPLEGTPVVELHPDDAAALEVSEGSYVRVWNDRGAVEVPVKFSQRVRPGVVSIPWGWWSVHHHHHLNGTAGSVANSLTNDAQTDWGGGVAYYDTMVALTAV